MNLPPNKDFTSNDVPAESRRWYERALMSPLNEFRRKVHALLDRGLSPSSNLNGQWLSRVVRIPASGTWEAQDFTSELRGPARVVLLARAVELDSANAPTTNSVGTWGVPVWQERSDTNSGTQRIHIVHQTGPSASKSYSVTWLALGE